MKIMLHEVCRLSTRFPFFSSSSGGRFLVSFTRCPSSGTFNIRKNQKLFGDMSGFYGGWRRYTMLRFVIVVKQPITTYSKLWLFSIYCVNQFFHNLKILLIIDCLTWEAYSRCIRPSLNKNDYLLDLDIVPNLTCFFGNGENACFHSEDWCLVWEK